MQKVSGFIDAGRIAFLLWFIYGTMKGKEQWTQKNTIR